MTDDDAGLSPPAPAKTAKSLTPSTRPPTELTLAAATALIEGMRSELEQLTTPAEARPFIKKARSISKVLKTMHAGRELENLAAAVVIRAVHRAGEILAATPKHKGGRPRSKQTDDMMPGVPTLAEREINPTDSSRWQQIASIPEAVLEDYIAQRISEGQQITETGVLTLARRMASQIESREDAESNTFTLHIADAAESDEYEVRQIESKTPADTQELAADGGSRLFIIADENEVGSAFVINPDEVTAATDTEATTLATDEVRFIDGAPALPSTVPAGLLVMPADGDSPIGIAHVGLTAVIGVRPTPVSGVASCMAVARGIRR